MIERAFSELERSVHTALETYSNVHRGTGHNSLVTTLLYEKARDIVLQYLGLDKNDFVVIFCSPYGLRLLQAQLKSAKKSVVSSQAIGLPLGVRALVIERSTLSKAAPFHTGGGSIKIVMYGSVTWADVPGRFESGTPSIINIIAFVKALQGITRYGSEIFKSKLLEPSTAAEILYQDEFVQHKGEELLAKLQDALIGGDVCVPTIDGNKPYINFDNAASTPTFLPIWETACQSLKQSEPVRREIIAEVQKLCADFFDAPLDEYELIFTSNTTEAINIAAQSLNKGSEEDFEPVVVNTLLEHHSNELPWRYISGASLIRLSGDKDGFLDLSELEKLLCDYNQKHKHKKKRIRLVAVSGTSNVLGSILDIDGISRITHKYGAHLLVDGAQSAAHHKISMQDIQIDFLAISGHKMYAPFGTGALIARKELLNFRRTELAHIKQSGEENVVGLAALGKAINLLQRISMGVIRDHERALTRRTLRGLSRIPGVDIYGVQDASSSKFRRRAGIIVFSLKRVPHNLVAKELAEFGGIGVRNGCFCAHILTRQILRIHPIRSAGARAGLLVGGKVGQAMSVLMPGLVRLSFGIENEVHEVDSLIQVLERINREPRSPINVTIASSRNGTIFLPRTETEALIEDFAKASIKKVYEDTQTAALKENPL
ncbi:MAG: aminotransferase class V-fold PLP-dependent enzyme [Candidatus Hodarchaeales archaeon]